MNTADDLALAANKYGHGTEIVNHGQGGHGEGEGGEALGSLLGLAHGAAFAALR